MKGLSFFLVISLCYQNAFASVEKRIFTKLNSKKVEIRIDTIERDMTDASAYVDGRENQQFIDALLGDKQSKLAEVKLKIEKDFCADPLKIHETWIEGCGEVSRSKESMTSFTKTGWNRGAATYSYLMGFTSEGSGKHFFPTHRVSFLETASAQIKSEGHYSGVILKSIELTSLQELVDDTP